MRRLITFLVALAALCAPACAHAAVSQKKGIWGPIEFQGDSQFPVFKQLHAGIWQTTLNWDQIATEQPLDAKDPEDPSYAWPQELDSALSDASDDGIVVALTVTGAPKWANGNRAAKFAPNNAKDFADFVSAAAKQYPGVHVWQVWDDPTSADTYRAASTHRYAQLLDGAYAALHARSKANRVISGNSTSKTLGKWLKNLTLPNGKRPRLDLYGQDISGTKAPTAKTLSSLDRAVSKALGRSVKDYLSASLPTKASPDASFHLTQAKQASWLKSALALTKKSKNVFTFSYRGLYDDSTVPGVARGLITTDGVKKPAFAAFERG